MRHAACPNHPDRQVYGDVGVCLRCHREQLASSGEAERARVANANETARLPLVKLRKLAAGRGHDIADDATVADLVQIITGARPDETPDEAPDETPDETPDDDPVAEQPEPEPSAAEIIGDEIARAAEPPPDKPRTPRP